VNGLQRANVRNPGLANIAATTLFLLGLQPPDGFEPSLLAIG
jgi:hypothetical protein